MWQPRRLAGRGAVTGPQMVSAAMTYLAVLGSVVAGVATVVDTAGWPGAAGGRSPGSAGALPPARPVRLEIPSIGVDTALGLVAKNADQTLQVPTRTGGPGVPGTPDTGAPPGAVGVRYARRAPAAPAGRGAPQAGWYGLGPSPGAPGAAVIVGLVDTARGPAVFYHVAHLRAGDLVRVRRDDGRTAVFRIDSVERVRADRFPTRKVYGAVAAAEIRLVTSGGRFDRASGRYADNVIAYGHLSR